MEEASRPATADDVPVVSRLVAQAEDELHGERGGPLWRASREAVDLGADLSDDDRHLLVATLDEVVVGYARIARTVLVDGTVIGTILDLYVDPGARQVGLGEHLMRDILGWCRSRGCAGVDAIALPGMRATKNFFEASGFTARLLVMHHRFTESEGA